MGYWGWFVELGNRALRRVGGEKIRDWVVDLDAIVEDVFEQLKHLLRYAED